MTVCPILLRQFLSYEFNCTKSINAQNYLVHLSQTVPLVLPILQNFPFPSLVLKNIHKQSNRFHIVVRTRIYVSTFVESFTQSKLFIFTPSFVHSSIELFGAAQRFSHNVRFQKTCCKMSFLVHCRAVVSTCTYTDKKGNNNWNCTAVDTNFGKGQNSQNKIKSEGLKNF